MPNCPGNDAHFVFGHVDVEARAHGVRLPRARLSVGQHGRVVAFEASFHQMTDRRVVDGTLSGIQVVTKVERERLVFA